MPRWLKMTYLPIGLLLILKACLGDGFHSAKNVLSLLVVLAITYGIWTGAASLVYFVVSLFGNHKRSAELRAWAATQQYDYHEGFDGPQQVNFDRWGGYPFNAPKAQDRRAVYTVQGHYDQRPFAAFQYAWDTPHHRAGDAGSRASTSVEDVVLVEVGASLPSLTVEPRVLSDKIRDSLTDDDVHFADEAFNGRYRVLSSDPQFAHQFLTPQARQAILAFPGQFRLRTAGVGLVCLSTHANKPSAVEAELRTLSAVLAASSWGAQRTA